MHTLNFLKTLTATSLLMLISCGGDDPDMPGGTTDNGSSTTSSTASTTGIDKFSNSNIFSRNTYLPTNTAMQGFNFDSKGNIYYTQLNASNAAQLLIVKAQQNTGTSIVNAKSDYMTLAYFGHGTNTAIEEDGNNIYVWAGCYGSCNSAGKYWTERLIGRVKYEKGATVKTDECNDYFYIGNYTDMHPSIDQDNDLLTINYADSGNSSYRCFVVYKLSDAKKAAYTNVTISVTDGYQTGNISSINKVDKIVRARDLTTLTPVASPKFLKTGYGNSGDTYYDWQGFDVNGDRLYYAEGQSNYNLTGNYNTGESYAYITIFDMSGKIVEKRTQVAVISDKEKLADIGVSVYGTMESEGVKIHNGKMYLGFTARGISTGNTTHYQNIFVFDKSSK